jgi:hypothetical protein
MSDTLPIAAEFEVISSVNEVPPIGDVLVNQFARVVAVEHAYVERPSSSSFATVSQERDQRASTRFENLRCHWMPVAFRQECHYGTAEEYTETHCSQGVFDSCSAHQLCGTELKYLYKSNLTLVTA